MGYQGMVVIYANRISILQPATVTMNAAESVTLDYTLHDLYSIDSTGEEICLVYAYAPPPNTQLSPSTPALTQFPVQAPLCPAKSNEELAQTLFYSTAQRFGFCSGPMRIIIITIDPTHLSYHKDVLQCFNQLAPHQQPMPTYTQHPKDLTLSPNSRLAVTIPLDWLIHLPHIIDPGMHYNLLSKRGLAESGLPTPKTIVIDTVLCPHHPLTDTELQEEVTRMIQPICERELPFIVKVPRVASIGQGTFIVCMETDRSAIITLFREEVKSMLLTLKPSNASLHPCNLIVQDMVPGETVGLTFFVTQSGKAIFNCCTKQKVDDAYCWSGGFVSYQEQPALEQHYRKTLNTVAKFLHAKGYFGPAGIDIMTDANGTQLVVDLNVRITGTYHLGALRGNFTRRGLFEAAALANQRFLCTLNQFQCMFAEELKDGSLLVTAWTHVKQFSFATITVAGHDIKSLHALIGRIASYAALWNREDTNGDA